MVELFILGKDGHQVIWCNLVSIFVICADRIPGVLAILRSKGHQESGGVTKSVHRWYIQLLYLTSKSSSSGVIAALKSQSVSTTCGWKRNQATGLKLNCCTFLERVFLQVSLSDGSACSAIVIISWSFLPGRIHEKLLEMLCKICRYISIHTFSPHPGVIIERVGVGGEEIGLCHQTWLWKGRLLSDEALWET